MRAPQQGRDLALSIDARMQYLAYRELKAAVDVHRAKAGGIVVLDVETGEVLAMANLPSLQPQQPRQARAAPHAQPRGHRSVRAGLDAEAVHRRGGTRSGLVQARHRGPDRRRAARRRQGDHPRRASGGRVDGGAGHPEVLQRRRRQDCARAARRRNCGTFSARSASARSRAPVSPARSRASCAPTRTGGRSSRRRCRTATAFR